MTITISRVETDDMLERAFTVRKQVFIAEQQVPEELELDQYDTAPETVHIVAQSDDFNPVGAARLRPYKQHHVCKIERVAVLKSQRGTGLGKALMEFLEAEAEKQGFREAYLNAQTHAAEFYRKLGYEPEGPLFYEAGIEHVAMRKLLNI